MNTSHFNKGQKLLNNEIKKTFGPDTEIEYGSDSDQRIENENKLRITISGKEYIINNLNVIDVEELGNPNNSQKTRDEILNNLLQLVKNSINNN